MSKEKQPIPSLSPEDLRKWVADFMANQIFIFQHISESARQHVGLIFMPLGLGGASHIDFDDVGTVYAYNKDAGPSGINGYPIFFQCAFMNKVDWEKARTAIGKLQHAQKVALDEMVPDDKPTG